ncbi:metallophosphoesterase [Spirochaetia bacterium]|nr:metallophosphoesterase [Spirochaetia bacterium]
MANIHLRVLMIGDVVGEPGLTVLEQRLPAIKSRHQADLTVVNGENAAGGFGLTAETLDRILAAGADVVTSGNHVWEKRDFWPILEGTAEGGLPVLRPANYPFGLTFRSNQTGPEKQLPAIPGTGKLRLEKNGLPILVINLQGRERMTAIDCPFRCFDRIFEEESAELWNGCPPYIIVDFHAESTEEKEALAYYLDGRASIVAGTHTHVPTADERILPKGTAYITDLGMTGAVNGVIGMDTQICLDRARTQVQYRMECAQGDPDNEGPDGKAGLAVEGIIAELDGQGRAVRIERILA